MASTTYRSFVDAVESLTVTGVNRKYQGQPTGATGVADCPAQFSIYPGGNERALVFGSQGGVRGLKVEFWVVVGPKAQNEGPQNYSDGVDMMDNVSTALQTASCFTKAKIEWDIDLVEKAVAGTVYWTVVTVIRGAI